MVSLKKKKISYNDVFSVLPLLLMLFLFLLYTLRVRKEIREVPGRLDPKDQRLDAVFIS